MPRLSVGVQAADLGRLSEAVAALAEAGVERLHFDVMDGVFVPRLMGGAELFSALRRVTDLPLDVHLMTVHPERHVAAFEGAERITVHAEATPHLHRALAEAERIGARPGVALLPGSHPSGAMGVLEVIEHVLLVAVDPGFPGARFVPAVLRKAKELKGKLEELGREGIAVGVDGGVNLENLAAIAEVADFVVSGSAVMRDPGPRTNLSRFFAVLEGGKA